MGGNEHAHVAAHSAPPGPETTPLLDRLRNFYRQHNRMCNNLITIFLIAVCLAAYILLLLLFINPASLDIDSFLWADAQGIKPQVAVALLSGVISACTLALVTRFVEHYFWLQISPPIDANGDHGGGGLRLAEVRDLADWTISPLGRLMYVFVGQFWTFKIAGFLLLGITVLNPVLVSGVSQKTDRVMSASNIPQKYPLYSNWIDDSNSRYAGGTFRDTPVQVAATMSLHNISAPAEPTLCSEQPDLCSVSSQVGSIQATCVARKIDNTADPIGKQRGVKGALPTRRFYSTFNPDLYVVLKTGDPNVFANFSTLRSADYDSMLLSPDTNGTYGVLFGAYVAQNVPTGSDLDAFVHTVDCLLSFGIVRVDQKGLNSPTLDRNSFIRSQQHVTDVQNLMVTHRIYNEVRDISPFSFTGVIGGATSKTSLTAEPIGLGILGLDAQVSGETAAARIEKAWDTATLMTWGKWPEASEETVVTREILRQVYVYNKLVLLFLLVPALATILAVLGTGWKVGEKESVLGYDPMAIASRGPVEGMTGRWGFLPVELEDRVVRGVSREWGKGWVVPGGA